MTRCDFDSARDKFLVSVPEPYAGTVPGEFTLAQNYPNPFNPTKQIMYGLPQQSRVRLTIYNVLGQEVATLVDEEQEAGSYQVRFDARGLASGIYFYRLQAGEFVETKNLLLVK